MTALQVLVAGSLWRDPVVRQSKAGKQFATALVKAGTQTETLWVNVAAFDQTAQSELLRLTAGDSISVQGTGKLGVFEKNGQHRATIEIVAAHVLALRQPPKKPTPKERQSAPPDFDDQFPDGFGGAPLLDAAEGMLDEFATPVEDSRPRLPAGGPIRSSTASFSRRETRRRSVVHRDRRGQAGHAAGLL